MGDFVRERVSAFGEALFGFGLMSMPLWSKALDAIVSGAHAVAAITGATIGVHAVWRIFRKRDAREEDVA